MSVFFVDGSDGVGKTGYSEWLSRELGYPRLEMRPVESTDAIEEKSAVFNATVRDLYDQDVDLVIDRGSVSSIVYSRYFDRGEPTHAWKTLEHVEPVILYLRCDAEELSIRYGNGDHLFDPQEIREFAELYDDVMSEVYEKTPAKVVTIDTTSGAVTNLKEAVFEAQHGGN